MLHRSAPVRPLRRMLGAGAFALALAALVAAPGGPAAADDTDDAITWSVQPADESGPDGRPWIEQSLDPGETTTEHLAVHNFSDADVTFRLSAADGFFNENGRFNILPSDQESTAAGTWIDIPDAVDVPAGETAVVEFTITVPDDAEPGDHAAGVAASILSSGANDGGSAVGVESRVGFRVMTRVTGELTPGVEVSGVTTDYRTAWNPFRPGALTVEFDVTNTGNTRVSITGVVTAGGQSADYPPADSPQELLVGDTRHFSVEVDGVWPLFVVPTTVVVDPTAIVVSGEAPEVAPIEVQTTAWAVPWPQLLLLAGIALIIVALLWGRRRSKAKLATALEQAREEGRRAAALSTESGTDAS